MYVMDITVFSEHCPIIFSFKCNATQGDFCAALWRRIAALPHKWIQSRLCGDFHRVVDTFMRRHATYKTKIAYMRRNGAFLSHKEVDILSS